MWDMGYIPFAFFVHQNCNFCTTTAAHSGPPIGARSTTSGCEPCAIESAAAKAGQKSPRAGGETKTVAMIGCRSRTNADPVSTHMTKSGKEIDIKKKK